MTFGFSPRQALLVALVVLFTTPPSNADTETSPADVFTRLKAMEGSWDAKVELIAGEAEEETGPLTARHDFRVSGAGTVVMETMGAGSDHEMINMYHMDGDDLVLTHYCAGGNQPTMKLDREMLAQGKLHFDFTGGTNLDPALDDHIHSATLDWNEDGTVSSDWTSWSGGAEAAVMQFVLNREQ